MNNKRKKYETDMNPFWAFEFDRDNIQDSKDDDTTLSEIFDSVTLQPTFHINSIFNSELYIIIL